MIMKRVFCSLTTLSLLALASLFAPSARAAEPASGAAKSGNAPEAQKAYTEGLVLLDKGDVRGALTKFELAHELYPTPVTTLEHAKTLMTLGRFIEAKELLVQVPGMPVSKTESDKSKRAREEAKKLAPEVEARLGELTVLYTYKDGKPCKDECMGMTLSVDGKVLAQGAIGLRVDPRKHIVTAKKGAWTHTEEVTMREREQKNLEFVFDAALAKRPGEDELPPRKPGMNPLAWMGFVGAGAFAIAGGVAGGSALYFQKQAKDCINKTSCKDDVSLIGNANLVGNLSTVAFAVSGAFLLTGLAGFFFLGPREARTPEKSAQGTTLRFHLAPWAGQGTLGTTLIVD
jgi:hypothetical protein